MVLNDTNTRHKGRCSCGVSWDCWSLAVLAETIAWHTAQDSDCVAEMVQP